MHIVTSQFKRYIDASNYQYCPASGRKMKIYHRMYIRKYIIQNCKRSHILFTYICISYVEQLILNYRSDRHSINDP